MGKLSFSHLDELYEKSRAIWKAEAERHAELKDLVDRKLQEFREKHDEAKDGYEVLQRGGGGGGDKSRMDTSRRDNSIIDTPRMDRSRSRDKQASRHPR